MTFGKSLAVATVLVLSACATETAAPEASAADPFIGKRLVSDDGSIVFLFNADGTVGGSFRGDEIVGAYTTDGNEICSTYTAPEKWVDLKPCSTPEIDGDTVVFNRRDGSQSSVYNIEG